jgi:membrane-bound metal-dependent hydrolase YbcI (DUF457 family)
MSPVGHTLTGLAIGYAVLPLELSFLKKMPTLVVFALLASGPDFLFFGWGRARYDISHSIFTALLAVLVMGVFIWCVSRLVSTAVLIGGALAWYSHLLLDTLYNHGRGLAMFWPASDASIGWPVPWFSHMTLSPLISYHNLQVFAVEGAVYGSILALIVLVKHLAGSRRMPFA